MCHMSILSIYFGLQPMCTQHPNCIESIGRDWNQDFYSDLIYTGLELLCSYTCPNEISFYPENVFVGGP